MFELLISILTFVAVMSLGGAVLSARSARRAELHSRLLQVQTLGEGPGDPGPQSSLTRFLGFLSGLASGPHATPSATLSMALARAGYHGRNAATIYMGSKVGLFLVAFASLSIAVLPFTALSIPLRLLLVLWGSGLMFFIPNLVISRRRNRRQLQIRQQLPDAIDLLEICVSSGMGLNAAWNAVGDEIRAVSGTLADELALTDLEMHLGAPRATAMRNMAARTGVTEISSLVSVLVQSERFGTSVAEALRAYANSMREMRSQRAEEAAEQMPVKLLFPLVLMLFPALIIVIAGPAGIQWMEIIAGGY